MKQVVLILKHLKSSSNLENDKVQKVNQKIDAIKWIENALKSEKVKSISFNQLENPEPLDKGGFGDIIKATWIKTGNYVVYKKLTNTKNIKGSILDAFVHELQIHLHLDYSERIIRCLGISQGNLIIFNLYLNNKHFFLYYFKYIKYCFRSKYEGLFSCNAICQWWRSSKLSSKEFYKINLG